MPWDRGGGVETICGEGEGGCSTAADIAPPWSSSSISWTSSGMLSSSLSSLPFTTFYHVKMKRQLGNW